MSKGKGSSQTGGGKKKRCYRGKSCGVTCISKAYLCVMNMPPELVAQLRYARDLVRKRHGKKHTYFGTNKRLSPTISGLSFESSRREIYKLSREYKKLPPGSKRRTEIERRIFELEMRRGANRGYDNSYYD